MFLSGITTRLHDNLSSKSVTHIGIFTDYLPMCATNRRTCNPIVNNEREVAGHIHMNNALYQYPNRLGTSMLTPGMKLTIIRTISIHK